MSVDYCSSLKKTFQHYFQFFCSLSERNVIQEIKIITFSHYPNTPFSEKKRFFCNQKPILWPEHGNKSCYYRKIKVFNILKMFLCSQGVPKIKI